jgi:hypothetical protein
MHVKYSCLAFGGFKVLNCLFQILQIVTIKDYLARSLIL